MFAGDRVTVSPADPADALADECTGMELFEDFVLEQVQSGAPIIGLHPPTRDDGIAKFEAWKTRADRRAPAAPPRRLCTR